eukprot:2146163-Prymnesium_polylepis.1
MRSQSACGFEMRTTQHAPRSRGRDAMARHVRPSHPALTFRKDGMRRTKSSDLSSDLSAPTSGVASSLKSGGNRSSTCERGRSNARPWGDRMRDALRACEW